MTQLTDDQQAVVAAARRYQEFDTAAKKATSELNKQKTALKNTILAFKKAHKIDPAATIQVDSVTYAYAPSRADVITADTWYKLFRDGELSERQFLDALSVSITAARDMIGEDQVITCKETVTGKTFDIRTTKEDTTVEFVVNTPASATVKARAKPVQTSVETTRRIRRVTVQRGA